MKGIVLADPEIIERGEHLVGLIFFCCLLGLRSCARLRRSVEFRTVFVQAAPS